MADVAEIYEEERKKFKIVGSLPWKGCTYKDYLSWGENVRCELIDGIPHMMARKMVPVTPQFVLARRICDVAKTPR